MYILIKLLRAIILFFSIYFVSKYFTVGKIPYNEIVMIGSVAVLVQTLLDIYRPLVVINNNEQNNAIIDYK
jgi:hypothetical protein